jgi:hypothetical protein
MSVASGMRSAGTTPVTQVFPLLMQPCDVAGSLRAFDEPTCDESILYQSLSPVNI